MATCLESTVVSPFQKPKQAVWYARDRRSVQINEHVYLGPPGDSLTAVLCILCLHQMSHTYRDSINSKNFYRYCQPLTFCSIGTLFLAGEITKLILSRIYYLRLSSPQWQSFSGENTKQADCHLFITAKKPPQRLLLLPAVWDKWWYCKGRCILFPRSITFSLAFPFCYMLNTIYSDKGAASVH